MKLNAAWIPFSQENNQKIDKGCLANANIFLLY